MPEKLKKFSKIEEIEYDNQILQINLKREQAEVLELRERLRVARLAQIPAYIASPGSMPLTEDFLRDVGFSWDTVEHPPQKHWTLKIGTAQKGHEQGFLRCSDALIVELAMGSSGSPAWWYCWLRADYAGRYTRLIYAREIRSVEQLVRLIEALTDTPFSPLNVRYGMLHTPEEAAKHRLEEQRLDWRIAKQIGQRENCDGISATRYMARQNDEEPEKVHV